MARNTATMLTRADGAQVPTVSYPPKLEKTPAAYRLAPPRVGENTFEVLRSELGLTDADIGRLVEAGVIEGISGDA